eukprot:scaffold2018_cov113-Cylindrotheca_fusiformis.AAC.14
MSGHDWCHGAKSADRRAFPNANLETQVEILPKPPRICHHVVLSEAELGKNDTSSTLPHVSTSNAALPTQASANGAASAPETATSTSKSSTTASTAADQTPPRIALSAQFLQTSVEAAVANHNNNKNIQNNNNSNNDKEKREKMSVDSLLIRKEAIQTPKKRKRNSSKQEGQTSGRWTREEHSSFLAGLQEFGREWKKVATRIPTRTSAQIRSHAQKYFAKLEREQHQEDAVEVPDPSASAANRQSLTPSVQRRVDRLLSDPHAAQREVESTMEALRERYRQLQLRLAQRTQRHEPRHHHHHHHNSNKEDDHSSVSSAISASVASLDNEELIALHVLGGALPRGDSSTEGLPVEEDEEEDEEEAKSDRSTTEQHGKKATF